MTLLQKIVAVMFVALWLPTTMHCSLEKLPGLQFLQCSTDTADNECKDDGCRIVESGLYKVSENSTIVPVPVFGFVIFNVLAELEISSASDFSIATAPTAAALPQRWQFVHRAALPVRAPSQLV
jgi:hypothetical protein